MRLATLSKTEMINKFCQQQQQPQQQQQQRDRDRDRDRDSGKNFSDDFLLGDNILNDSEKSKPLPSFQK